MSKKEWANAARMKRKAILGKDFASAQNDLKRMLLFDMAKQLSPNNILICFQCGEPIKDHTSLSIEHKIPWLNSNTPIELFYDLSNVAFSHLSCNIRAGKKNTPEQLAGIIAYNIRKRRTAPEGYASCNGCKQTLELCFFGSNKQRWDGISYHCKECQQLTHARSKVASNWVSIPSI